MLPGQPPRRTVTPRRVGKRRTRGSNEHLVCPDGLLGLVLLLPALSIPVDAPGGGVALSGGLKLLTAARPT